MLLIFMVISDNAVNANGANVVNAVGGNVGNESNTFLDHDDDVDLYVVNETFKVLFHWKHLLGSFTPPAAPPSAPATSPLKK